MDIGRFNQATLFFSNSVEVLLTYLKNLLFPKGSTPFSERVLITPSQAMQQWLQIELASSLSISSGIHTTFLDKAIEDLTNKLFIEENTHSRLSQLELALCIEQELKTVSGSIWEPINQYIQGNDRRAIDVAQHLAALFVRYGTYGNRALLEWETDPKNWQQALWQRIALKWNYPQRALLSLKQKKNTSFDLSVHLFAFSHLSRLHFFFFQQVAQIVPVYFYQLSACREFWSDLFTDRQAVKQKEVFQEARPSLLANLGKVGKEMARLIEESDVLTHESYVIPETETQLHRLQKDLLLFQNTEEQPFEDNSIQIHSSTTPHREVENLYHTLLSLLSEDLEPKDILVMAPKITTYAPYIQALFGHELEYQIADMPLQKSNAQVEGLFSLLELEQKRWNAIAVLELFAHPLFCKKQGLNEEDLNQIREWVQKTGIRWGLDAAHRDHLLKKASCEKEMKEGTGTWKEGIDHLLEELAIPFSPSRIEFTQAELLGKLATLLYALYADLRQLEVEKTLLEWMDFLKSLVEKYFYPTDEQQSLFIRMEKIAKAGRFFSQRRYSFVTISSLLKEWIGKESTTVNKNSLQAIRFCSMLPMRAIPAKVICLLGMNHDAFPRKEELQTLDLLKQNQKSDYSPSRVDFDRYLFLEAFLSTREKLIISYQGRDFFDLSELPPSSVVSELLPFVCKKNIIAHPARSYDTRYFDHSDCRLKNTSQRDFRIATSFENPPLSVEFDFQKPSLPVGKFVIEMADLLRLARSPLQHYLHSHHLKIGEERPLKVEETLTLSPLKRAIARKTSLMTTPDIVLKKIKKEGDFPPALFGKLAHLQLKEEMAKQPKLELEEVELKNVKFSFSDTLTVHLFGSIEGVFSEGLCFAGQGTLAGAVKAWPLYLLLNLIDPSKGSLFFVSTHETKKRFFDSAEPFLHAYLEFFFLAQQSPVPLVPQWIEPILKKDVKGLQEVYDPVLQWVLRGKAYDPEALISVWNPYVDKLYGEMADAWF